ncbi:ABC transporter [Ochrobactrum sp. MYb15]|uniref:ABC transporter ATP-binding protein n=1 Tax=Brucella pituitosa TaxID=571256 RepID=UPI000CFD1218|nr:ABC transporter [Ochrobactrum sp. MYb19]PRA65380.1 ABC transporter [Ochrobactrum sp. MYb18]PRA77070.1 ABC transporter [Brucella thiophenivorans]PRA93298.1 ABC transporter [Ochrobactrum sp. MYb14]PRA99078.1 ABC transporter [Ochrobactrum sp. MYb15]
MSTLSVHNLDVSLGRKAVLETVGFEAGEGEFIGLIGPNGAGKTTLLRALLNLTASTGNILLDGSDFRRMCVADRAKVIAYLPQERDVAWPVTVRMLVSLGRSALKPVFAGLDGDDETVVETAMQRMGVAELASRPANELSGGERARALIARVLAQDTPVILADEPVAGLDPAHQLELMELFAGLATEKKTVIASLHDLGLAAKYCTRLIVLNKGRLVVDGAPEDVLTPALLKDVYGIDARLLKIDDDFIVHTRKRLR